MEQVQSPPQAELSLGDRFAIERFSREINACSNVEDLRKIAIQLMQWGYAQKSMTLQAMKSGLPTAANAARDADGQ
jgi:hypothetical protein